MFVKETHYSQISWPFVTSIHVNAFELGGSKVKGLRQKTVIHFIHFAYPAAVPSAGAQDAAFNCALFGGLL